MTNHFHLIFIEFNLHFTVYSVEFNAFSSFKQCITLLQDAVLDIGIHLRGVFDSLIFADPLHLFVISFFFFLPQDIYCVTSVCELSHCAGPLACVVHGNFVS